MSGPERQSIVLLVGGPYDGQDIAVSIEEWMRGSLIRNGYRYVSETGTFSGAGSGSSGIRIFTCVDPARQRGE